MTTGRVHDEAGKQGEQIARSFLEQKGYIFIASRLRSRWGEIDLLMRDKNTLVAAEVKCSDSADEEILSERISFHKLYKILLTLRKIQWQYGCSNSRIDAVYISRGKIVSHLQNLQDT
jgi:putative endonuclease